MANFRVVQSVPGVVGERGTIDVPLHAWTLDEARWWATRAGLPVGSTIEVEREIDTTGTWEVIAVYAVDHDGVRCDVDALPSVAPLLARFRSAKADRDRILADRRMSQKRRDDAEDIYSRAAEEYRLAFQRERDRLAKGGA